MVWIRNTVSNVLPVYVSMLDILRKNVGRQCIDKTKKKYIGFIVA